MNDAALWVGAAAGALIGLLLAEVADVGAWISPKLIRSAAKRLPTIESRDRYQEEWLAELHAFDGLKLIKLAKAISLLLGSWRVRNVLRSQAGYVGIGSYSRWLAKVVSKWGRYAWKAEVISGAPGEDAIRRNPEWIFHVISAELMFQPAGGLSNVEMTRCGTDSTSATIYAVRVPLTVPARLMLAVAQVVALVVYDLWLVRKRYVSVLRLSAENSRISHLERHVEYRERDPSIAANE